MTTRRSFLRQGGAAAGALAIGCNRQETTPDATKEAAVAPPPSTHTLELVIGGLFLFVEDQDKQLVHLVAPATGKSHTAHDMYLLFSKSSTRSAEKLARARIDFSRLGQGVAPVPSAMLDVNDVVHGKRLRMKRTHFEEGSGPVAHVVTLGGGTFSVVSDECCTLGSGSDSTMFTVAGRIQWSCPVATESLALAITSLDTKEGVQVDRVVAESGKISLGLVHGYGNLPPTVDDLRTGEYPGSWEHFKAFYQFWSEVKKPEAPGTCIVDFKRRDPSQCGPGRVAAEP